MRVYETGKGQFEGSLKKDHFQVLQGSECGVTWRVGRRKREALWKAKYRCPMLFASYYHFFCGFEGHLYCCWFWNVLSPGWTSPFELQTPLFSCFLHISTWMSNGHFYIEHLNINTLICAFKPCSTPRRLHFNSTSSMHSSSQKLWANPFLCINTSYPIQQQTVLWLSFKIYI